uniref:Uncharacterized protein n=1 Tax=Caenorhabditis japonica TaxID=281687 RepID=A0A8R1HYW9_CAEJA
MSGMERIQNCSAGVFDVEKLDVKTFAESDCFSFRKFIDLTSEWGRPEPRPKTRYEKSPHVGCDRIAEKLAKFSVNKVLGRKKNESLQDVIKDYIMTVDGINHMFCVHSHERPQVFFGRTILDVAVRLSSKSHELKAFPTVLIVTRTVESAKSIVGSFIRRKSERSCPIHIGDLGNLDDVREESSLRDKTEPRRKSDILIGSAHDVQAYLGRLKSNRELDLLKLTVKHCILCDVEGLPVDQEFEEACKRICSTFQFSPTTFIFMYNFLKADSNLLSAKRACQQMVKGKVFIEIERNGDRKIFGNVKFHWVTTADDLANHLAVVELSKGNENFNFDAAKMVLTARVQKMQQCAKIIDDLREKRSDRNANQNQTRKERILVITKDSRTAISVTIYLRLAGAGVYTVKKMLVAVLRRLLIKPSWSIKAAIFQA